MGLRMLLLLYAIIHCLAAYVLHLVCMISGTAIPTLSNMLMKMFYILVYSRLVLSQSGISSALSLVSTIASVPAISTMHTHFVYVQANSKISQMNGYTHSGVW